MTAHIQLKEGIIRVSGDLNAVSVPKLLDATADLFRQSGQQVRIDLAKVTRADSSGLALLIDWMRTARRQHQQLSFRRLPAQLLDMARVSGIEALLPLSE